MPRANKPEEKTSEEQLAELQAKLEVEQKARQEAEVRAEQIEAENDLSIRKTVAAEAAAVAELAKNREPRISFMFGGTKRIDF